MRGRSIPVAVGAVILLATSEAAAYIDPGTGDMLFQFLIAAVLVILFTVKLWFPPVLARLRKILNRQR